MKLIFQYLVMQRHLFVSLIKGRRQSGSHRRCNASVKSNKSAMQDGMIAGCPRDPRPSIDPVPWLSKVDLDVVSSQPLIFFSFECVSSESSSLLDAFKMLLTT